MVVLGELLADGDASRLYQSLVKGQQLALQLESFTGAGSPWEYDGPALFTVLAIYKPTATADQLLAAIDAEIAKIIHDGVDAATLQAVKTRLLAHWYDDMEGFMDRADTLAILQALWGDASIANKVPDWIAAVRSADLQRVARTYLTRANRSEIDRRPDVPVEKEKKNAPSRSEAKPRTSATKGKTGGDP
jgi:predicted Zn-dependent peptidase